VITVDAGVPTLARLDDADVSLIPLVVGEVTVHSLVGEKILPLQGVLAFWAGADVDFSGYYRAEPVSLVAVRAGGKFRSSVMVAPAASQAEAGSGVRPMALR
jgi:hypothetical protein